MISHIAAVNDEVLKQCLSSLTYFSDKLLLLRAIGRPASDMAGGMWTRRLAPAPLDAPEKMYLIDAKLKIVAVNN